MLHPVHLVTGGESCSKGTTYNANYNPTITRSVHTTAAIFVCKCVFFYAVPSTIIALVSDAMSSMASL